MMRTYQIALIFALFIGYSCATFAQDTTFNRVVTVERDYQPDIQEAQAITTTPTFIQFTPQLNPVVYSTYSAPLSIGYNLHALTAAETQFRTPNPLNGILGGAFGHRNTHFLFGYSIKQKKKMSLDTYANHNAYWGDDALSQSKLGIQVTRHFSDADLYFGVEGNNDAYTNFGDWKSTWQAKTKIGIKSTGSEPIQYHIQTGYQAFFATGYAVEHQICSKFNMSWNNDNHKAGLNAYIQNNLYTATDTTLKEDISARHAIRIEPFYEFKNKNIKIHAGINVDLNIGTGELLSSSNNISFAPSPNLNFEWNMMDNIFHVYANATGQYGLGSWEEYLGYNRYLNPLLGLTWDSPRAYTPVDAQVGFKIRPAKTLLIDIYGGYAYMLGACNMHAEERYDQEGIAYYSLWQDDYQRWKVGANLHYHYRDILEINLGGNYYFYQQEPIPSMDPDAPYFQEARVKGTHVFDRPNWDAYARIEAHIDSKWSVYSENYFAGSRFAYVQQYPGGASAVELRPIISLNIGGQYAINRWLSVYLQLNDYLNRKNDIFYGYQEQGLHFLLGVKWRF